MQFRMGTELGLARHSRLGLSLTMRLALLGQVSSGFFGRFLCMAPIQESDSCCVDAANWSTYIFLDGLNPQSHS
jgi:hypothetical protein